MLDVDYDNDAKLKVKESPYRAVLGESIRKVVKSGLAFGRQGLHLALFSAARSILQQRLNGKTCSDVFDALGAYVKATLCLHHIAENSVKRCSSTSVK
jgi:hypothetical protein